MTNTTADIREPAEWRQIMERFHARLEVKGVSASWRVELQKRGAPHVHMDPWTPADLANPGEFLTLAWLKSIGGEDLAGLKPGEREHAVVLRSEPDQGWLNYQAAHSTKHKVEQLGWLGKQWGIWGRRRYVRREPGKELWDGTGQILVYFLRGYRRYCEAQLHRKRVEKEACKVAALRRYLETAEAFKFAYSLGSVGVWETPVDRIRLRPSSSYGEVVRVCPEDIARRLLAWATVETIL